MYSSIKEERHDEAEIQELAAQMMEAHRAKMQNPKPHVLPKAQASSAGGVKEPNQNLIGDEESQKGRFGWVMLGKNPIPFILRSTERYCAVRMLEAKVLNKYLTFLHQDIYNCTCIRSYYITEAEGRLLNEINFKHCDYLFGREQFTPKDLVVRLSDAREFYHFLDTCYTKLLHGTTHPQDRCGFIRINQESVVPYTMYNTRRFVPLFYFEGETDNLTLKATNLEGWNLSYLKFCCKVQGIRNELFSHESCSVICLDDVKDFFPSETLFEDYWPNKVADSQLLINGKTQTQMGQWTRQPTGPPLVPTRPPPSPKPATQAKAANNDQLKNVQTMYSSYGLTGAQSVYPAMQNPRTATSAVRPSYPSTAATSPQTNPLYYTNVTPAPPPLMRGSQQAASFRNAQTSYMMIGDSTPSGYQQAAPQMHKYPPPLIPVSHLNGELYNTQQNHYRPNMADLSAANSTAQPHQVLISQQPTHQQQRQPPHQQRQPPHQQQRQPPHQQRQPPHQQQRQPPYQQQRQPPHQQRQPLHQRQPPHQLQQQPHQLQQPPQQQQSLHQQQQQPHQLQQQPHQLQQPPQQQQSPHQQQQQPHQLQQPPHQQQQQPIATQPQEEHHMTNGRVPVNNLQTKLTPIAETPTNGNEIPYKMQKAVIENRRVLCINMNPYVYTDLLVTIPDLLTQLFNHVPVQSCQQVMQLLGIELFKGNNSQMHVLYQNGKCQSLDDIIPLVPIKSVLEYMPQLKYMLGGLANPEVAVNHQHAN